jgi:hypothetical protein
MATVLLPPDGGPSSSSRRRPTSEPAAAAEILDEPRERLVYSKQVAAEELTCALTFGHIALGVPPVPAKHVPDVLMTRPHHRGGFRGKYLVEEVTEGAFPSLAAVLAAE